MHAFIRAAFGAGLMGFVGLALAIPRSSTRFPSRVKLLRS